MAGRRQSASSLRQQPFASSATSVSSRSVSAPHVAQAAARYCGYANNRAATRRHEEILCRDEDKCGCDQWFDHRRRQPHDIEHGQAEVSEWARVKAVTTLTSGHRLRPQRIKAKRTAM
jgi:hypothetical protein